MKRAFVKTVLILCMVLIAFSTFEGCGSRDNKDFEDILPESDGLEPAILTFYMAGEEKKAAREVHDKIAEASKLNIELDFKWYGYVDYFSRVKAAFASNANFDAFLCGRSEQGTLDIANMFRNGQIKDITELLPRYAPAICSQLSEEGMLDAAKVDGKNIYVPSLSYNVEVLGVYIRTDYADRYNISAVNSLDDYGRFLKNIKDNENNVIPGFIAGPSNYDINFYANAFGYAALDYSQNLVYKWDDPEMKIIPWEQTPEFKETTGFISSWFKNGYLDNNSGKEKDIASLLCVAGNLKEGPCKIDLFSDGNREAYNFYILYKDKKLQRESPLNSVTISAVAFNSNSKNTERVLMFLDWIQSSQENYDLFNYGLKDSHYILKGERIGMPAGMTVGENPYWWHGLNDELLNYPFMNIKFNRQPINDAETDTDDNDKQEYIQFIQSYTSYAPHEGFYPDYTKMQEDCGMRLKVYAKEITGAFQMGVYDVNKTDSIVEELKRASTDRIAGEIQKQLDHWRSENK